MKWLLTSCLVVLLSSCNITSAKDRGEPSVLVLNETSNRLEEALALIRAFESDTVRVNGKLFVLSRYAKKSPVDEREFITEILVWHAKFQRNYEVLLDQVPDMAWFRLYLEEHIDELTVCFDKSKLQKEMRNRCMLVERIAAVEGLIQKHLKRIDTSMDAFDALAEWALGFYSTKVRGHDV